MDFKNSRGLWDPDRWHQGRRKGQTPPPTNTDKDKEDKVKMRLLLFLTLSSRSPLQKKDAKDRLKAEQEGGLVLSPQRRSFLSGCQGSQVRTGRTCS